MQTLLKYPFFLLPALLLMSCNLEKEIDIEIPDYENGYIVESYISTEDDFGLLITKTYGFFEVFDSNLLDPNQLESLLVQGVDGYIEVNGERHLLVNQIKVVPGSTTVYNYLLQDEVKFQTDDNITLSLTFPTGEKVQAVAHIPETRPVDSVRLDIDDKMEAREVTFLSTDSVSTEYFRRQLFRVKKGKIEVIQDYVTDNKTAKGGKLAFGSGYEYDVGDTLISRITHIEKPYYDFYLSVTGSINANTNPFGQPGRISSNIKGSDKVIGIFTGINQSQILKKVEE